MSEITLETRRLRLVSVVVGVVLVASLGYAIAVAVTAADSEAPGATPTPTVAANWPAGDLRWLLATPPDGATPVESLGSPDHTLSIGQAAAIYAGTGSSLSYLTRLGYVQGAATAWRVQSPRYDVRISLFQFGAAAQAAAWVTDAQRSLPAAAVESATPIEEIPGAMSMLVAASGAEYRVVQVVFRQGSVGVYMTFWCYPSAQPDVVTSVAADQYAKLPAA